MSKAIFLDRDGTINKDEGSTYTTMKVELFPGVADGLRRLKDAGYKLIVVTNQGGIGSGKYTEDTVIEYNHKLVDMLEEQGIYIDEIYLCPHDNRQKAEGERCACAKPGIGMLTKAAEDHGLNLTRCWMIGDKTSDIKAGKSAGCRTVLVKTGWAGTDGRFNLSPDFSAGGLDAAADIILNQDRSDDDKEKNDTRR
jgi:D,D-heptose 1,7-bisphosphate phosphatase